MRGLYRVLGSNVLLAGEWGRLSHLADLADGQVEVILRESGIFRSQDFSMNSLTYELHQIPTGAFFENLLNHRFDCVSGEELAHVPFEGHRPAF